MSSASFDPTDPTSVGSTPEEREAAIVRLLGELSLEEKVFMLSGHGFFQQFIEDDKQYCKQAYHIGAGNERLGVPGFYFLDGPRGVGMGASTCFPVPMARGASFDKELEQRIGDAIGREMRAYGANLFGGVCINLLRHPAWGRAQETYGEDPFLLGEMGSALVRGVQHHNVVATPKHFAANSMENARFTVNVEVDERALREVYLQHFKRCIDAGAGAVMSAYNQLNGAYCGHNETLLTRILKDEWGFDGFVYSDFGLGCRGADACASGLDLEAPDTLHYGPKLLEAVKAGIVSEERIEDAATRILRKLFEILARPDPEAYSQASVACDAHIALAQEAAEKSIVLLENRDLLPWKASEFSSVLVLGELADVENLGDHGSSRVRPPRVITPCAGLRDALSPTCELIHDPGADLQRVETLSASADAVLIVAGYCHRDEGEFITGEFGDSTELSIGGDRLDLTLGPDQEAMILAAAKSNKNVVVAVMAGSAVIMENWRNEVGGIVYLFYPGMEGGAALADVLLGKANPSGRLPFSIPAATEDLPYFDRDATETQYDLWHGYSKFDRDGKRAAYSFGFGGSYSEFEWSDPSVVIDEVKQTARVEITVKNTVSRSGDAVVQVYAGWSQASADQPRKRLCGFERVGVPAEASVRAGIDVRMADLAFFDVTSSRWVLGADDWTFYIGASSDEEDLRTISVRLPKLSWSIRER